MRNGIRTLWDRTESLVTNRWVSVGLLMLAMFWTFFSVDLPSVGLECLLVACLLWVFHVRGNRQMRLAGFALILCVAALAMLLFSGRYGEIGFNAPVGHALKFVYIFFVQVIALVMFRLEDKHRRTIMLLGMVVILFSVLVSLYYAIFVDKYAIRYYAERGFYQVVDFNQMYAVPIVITAIVCLLLSKVKKVRQLLVYVPFLLLTMVCVYLSLYTTALLLMILGIGVAVLFSLYYRSPKAFWIVIAVLGTAVVLCFLFRQQVSDLVYALTEEMNWLVRARIRSVVDMILGTSQENWYTPERRNELAGYSISSFLSSPVFGIGYAGYAYGTIGCHQEWYDMLGVFGVVGTACFVGVMALWSVLTFRSARTTVDKASFLICLFLFVVLGFLNPVLNLPVLVAVFMIAPNISALPLEWSWVKERLGAARAKLAGLRRRGEEG